MTIKQNAIRQQRFRSRHRRIDYVPDDEVLAIIEKHCKLMPWNMAGVIDELIRAGDKAVTGNDANKSDVSLSHQFRNG